MTSLSAVIALLATTKKTTTSASPAFFIVILAVGVAFYFLFYKPQKRKAAAAASQRGSDLEVGDEVQTIGGVIGTILEIHGDRYTLLTGLLNEEGNLDGPQPTRIVFVRQAIARKVEPLVPTDLADGEHDVSAASSGASDLGATHNGHGDVDGATDGTHGTHGTDGVEVEADEGAEEA
jgi:preprotein translocase subunit YajC